MGSCASICGRGASGPHGVATDLSKYYDIRSLRKLIGSGDVILVKASYLLELNASRSRMPRRQELPPHAIVDRAMLESLLSELEATSEGGGPWSATFSGVVVTSYAWGCREHPDPDGEQLQSVLAPAIEWYMSERARRIQDGSDDYGRGSGWTGKALTMESVDFGIFFDYLSLHQWPRSEGQDGEDAAFRRALQQMDLLYAHQQTVKWRLTRQMPGALGLPYHKRGWPFFETSACGLISWDFHVLDLGLVDFAQPLSYEEKEDPNDPGAATWQKTTVRFTGARKPPEELAAQATYESYRRPGVISALRDRRLPPVVPSAFADAVNQEKVKFTNNADVQSVIRLQQRVSQTVLDNVETLSFNAPHWTPEEGARLAEALSMCSALSGLIVQKAPLGDAGAAPVLSLLGQRAALPQLADLRLYSIGITSSHLPLLVSGLAARPRLEVLGLSGNALGDDASAAVVAALPEGLAVLYLADCGLADRGLAALCSRLGRGGLKQLDWIRVHGARNKYTSISPLVEALRAPDAAPKLRTLRVREAAGFDELRALAQERRLVLE